MKVLIWNCPFPSQGNLFFFENSFRRHLLLQANLLSSMGIDVSVAYPSHFKSAATGLAPAIHHVVMTDEVLDIEGLDDTLVTLYREEGDINERVASRIAQFVPKDIDVVLTWENPVGYLKEIYPEALVINQMPGAFCRAPYPNTVTFDPSGLYRGSLLSLFGNKIISGPAQQDELRLATQFRDAAWSATSRLSPFDREDLGRPSARKVLLPLQISDHYAFKADTNLSTQLDLLTAARKLISSQDDLLVTQYRSKFASDIVLTDQNIEQYKSLWPNLIWRPALESLQSPSQLLLPLIDEVITASSSIGLQAVAFGLPVTVIGNTHVSPFDTKRVLSLGLTPGGVKDRLSAFLLGRYQPLYTSITADGPFLVSLLEELLAKRRAGLVGPESTASLLQLDPNYHEKLLQAFNTGVVAREVAKAYPKHSSRWKVQDEYTKFASKEEVKYLTFDVFDTLICRPTENPSDVFHFIQAKLDDELGLRFPDFAKVRMDAENDARERSPDPEISLPLIYDIVAERLNMSDAERELVLGIEVELEVSFVRPRAQGRELWQAAKRLGKPIVLISDMYLPHDVVDRMVRNCGFGDFQKLYVSSEHGARKKDGSLFDLVLGALGVEGSAVLHVGDHIVADIRNAQARKMLALRTPRAIDLLRKNAAYAEVYRPSVGTGLIARSAIVGLTAKKLFDVMGEAQETLFFGDAKILGFSAVGPLYVGFALWLRDQAMQQKVKRLFFLSREGHLMKRVYDAVTLGNADAPKSTYLYASRRAIRIAALENKRDVAEVASQPYTEGVALVALLRDRFGLDAARIVSVLDHCAIDSTVELSKTNDSRAVLNSAVAALTDDILAIASQERADYLAYLESEGLTATEQFAVVDLGWKGNMQGGLGRLLKKPLVGFYFATLAGAERWEVEGHKLRGYAGESLGPWSKNALLKRRHLVESLACHNDASLICMQRRNESFVPVFKDDVTSTPHKLTISRIHDGAVQFANEFYESYHPFLLRMKIDPELATALLSHLIEKPHALDAALVSGITFEDTFGGVAAKSILSGAKLWPEGELAINKAKAPKEFVEKPEKVQAIKKSQVAPKERPEKVTDTTSKPVVGHSTQPRRSNEPPTPPAKFEAVEKFFIDRFASKQKQEKYHRNPDRYFRESKSLFSKMWLSVR